MNSQPMRCPHCDKVWNVRERTLQNADRFRCPNCGKWNDGSCCADENGVLVGMIMSRAEKAALRQEDI